MTKIGIYNPYLDSKGGGEKVCLALAEKLAKQTDNQVYLITHGKVDLEALANYFEVDLSKVKVLIINFKSLGMKISSRLPLTGAINNLIHDLKVFHRVRRGGFDIFINNCYQSNLPAPAPQSIYMCMFPQKIDPSRQNVGLLKSVYARVMRLIYRSLLHPRQRHAVYTYNLITANSAYTQKYIKKFWNLPSYILYPICQDMLAPGHHKQNKIVSVGRFFARTKGSHHKRHDFLLDTFLDMPDLIDNGWELHIAGSVSEDIATLKYLLKLMKRATGQPVSFHFNASFPELQALYNDARIYWHATGYGSNLNSSPETQEHFGITTVEAMSANCTPVVYNSAGQKESVVRGKNGYLWSDAEELMTETRQLINLPDNQLAELQTQGRQTAARFNKASFDQQVLDMFDNHTGRTRVRSAEELE